jgi:histidyl-tRNA synthetase
MIQKIQAIRGMNDILPDSIHCWHYLEAELRRLTAAYGYQEIRMPVVEQVALFKRGIGEVTDIVEKEMYVFEDRNGDHLALRPEATAGCVRAAIEHGLLHNQTQRLYYLGAMYRHERPQRGRYRQFYQFGMEAFGFSGPDIDVEMIAWIARLWKQLGLTEHLVLQLNSLGDVVARQQHREALTAFLQKHRDDLDADSQRRLDTNPLRILDSKVPQTQHIVAKAPMLIDYLAEPSLQHFENLKKQLDDCGIHYVVNPRLVRGLDYYTNTVFEWVTELLGAQSTVAAGGHYDNLVEQLGGKPTPAIGFSIGMERVLDVLQQCASNLPNHTMPQAYLIVVGEQAERQALCLAEKVRDCAPMLRMVVNCGGGSYKSQFKRADKSGADIAIVLGEEEASQHRVAVKFLRSDEEQVTIDQAKLAEFLMKEVVK